jgi:hypothetical protein
LKKELRALLLATETVKNSFVKAHYHGVSPAFTNELGYFISIIQQLLLVQTSDVHEFEQFAAVTRLIGQCYQTLDGVASRLCRAIEGERDDKRKSSLLRTYIKEQLQNEIEGLRDMISKNISAVSTMLSIRNITRSTSFEIAGPGQETIQTRRRSSSAGSFDLDDEEKPLLPRSPSPKLNERRPRKASKIVRFEPLPGLDLPPPVYPHQGPLGLSDVATNIKFLANRLDVESQGPVQKPVQGVPRCFISLFVFGIFFSVGLAVVLYLGIKKHDFSNGVGVMGALLSLGTMVDQGLQWLRRRNGVRCGVCSST